MKRMMFSGLLLGALIGCGDQAPTTPATTPNLSAEAAKYEAEKLLAALNGKAKSAAFIDKVLANDPQYHEIFRDGLQKVIADAPKDAPAFAPYRICVEAATALLKFAELRKIAGRQNEESDAYRQPFWDGLDACERAVKG